MSVADVAPRIQALLQELTLEEKIGQLQQVQGGGGHVPDHLADAIRAGRVGSIINEVDPATTRRLQAIARHESRCGIPLLIGRDVIHGFATVFPIPLGMASSWNPDAVRRASRIAALEAAACGVHWTFAPMLDIGRDPRWGRVAEGFGEDPYLTSVLGVAAVEGFQGDDLSQPGHLAACAKHFVGYGASESGRDYNSTNIAPRELHDVHLPPFEAVVRAGVASVMTSFSDIDGVPATAHRGLLQGVLRDTWGFGGMVLSDWDAVRQLSVHGITADDREAATQAALAGVDMEMASTTYADHLAALVRDGTIPLEQLDAMVARVLALKLRLGLFDEARDVTGALPPIGNAEHLQAAREVAHESIVLLTNGQYDGDYLLPLDASRLRHLAVIGPLADDPHEQLGTWVFDGDVSLSRSVLDALRDTLPDHVQLSFARGLPTTRSHDRSGFAEAVDAAAAADIALLVVGEEAILSGEAHCRADITLPGEQERLIEAVAATGTPVVLVIMAGRALALERVIDRAQAVFYAWHPGAQGGPALVDLLLGRVSPSARLPVTLPRATGQIPIYHAHKHTGKPATPETIVSMHDIHPRAPQLSVGNTSFHLDVHPSPLFPFGHGLTYTWVHYDTPSVHRAEVPLDGMVELSTTITNRGAHAVVEVVQLYVRDLVGSVTRPVKELKGFQRVPLVPGERRTVHFSLPVSALAFTTRDYVRRAEPGRFHAWIGAHAATSDLVEFTVHG
jgi:beta-glucosidase